MMDPFILKAERFCEEKHAGQTRKNGSGPYSSHPKGVTSILGNHGHSDRNHQCIALLHDVVEDTEVITKEIKRDFGYEIANGVYILSRNTITPEIMHLLPKTSLDSLQGLDGQELHKELYKLRILFARKTIQRVKIADMIHNTSDLQYLPSESIERKIRDAEFYLPLGNSPGLSAALKENIDWYLGTFRP